MIAAAWPLIAGATDSFDPTTPDARFEGRETWTQVEDVQIWSAIERWDDPDPGLFAPEAFNAATAWRDTDSSPWIATAFGTPTPPSSTFLLHAGPSAATAVGTPIVMFPGAGDNASRAYVTLATRLDRTDRPVYAVTFGHPHGDVLMQAEIVADAIAAVKARTGADQVDVIGHSKGGIAAAVYAASGDAEAFGVAPYTGHATRYRGDIRRLVLVATPMGGVDTSFRWPGLNLYGLDPDTALSPVSWDRYYSSGSAVPLVYDDLVDQDFLPDGRDLFPGQRQVLHRQDPPLPGTMSWLGVYALQPDWFTTYEGGTGFVSRSDGIDAAIEAGGSLIDALATAGIDPSIEVFQLAGTNPLLPNGDDGLASQFEVVGNVVDYAELAADLTAHGVPVAPSDDELAGLDSGALVLGEITGRSDGLVFLSSASDDRAVTARGGAVVERYAADVSHLDLLYASPITGQLLIDAADAGTAADAWMRGVGARYTAADTLGWIERVLADPPGPTTGSPSTDTGTQGTSTPGDGDGDDDNPFQRPCGSCGFGGAGLASGWTAVGAALAAIARRRRR